MRRTLTALTTLAAAAAVAMIPLAAQAAAHAPAARAGEFIFCQSLDQEGTTVHGQNCDTTHWGPLSDFTLAGPNGRAYRCTTGWAEGSLWVRGQQCRSLGAGGARAGEQQNGESGAPAVEATLL